MEPHRKAIINNSLLQIYSGLIWRFQVKQIPPITSMLFKTLHWRIKVSHLKQDCTLKCPKTSVNLLFSFPFKSASANLGTRVFAILTDEPLCIYLWAHYLLSIVLQINLIRTWPSLPLSELSSLFNRFSCKGSSKSFCSQKRSCFPTPRILNLRDSLEIQAQP